MKEKEPIWYLKGDERDTLNKQWEVRGRADTARSRREQEAPAAARGCACAAQCVYAAQRLREAQRSVLANAQSE